MVINKQFIEKLTIDQFLSKIGNDLKINAADVCFVFYRYKAPGEDYLLIQKMISEIQDEITALQENRGPLKKQISKTFDQKEKRVTKSEPIRVAMAKIKFYLFPLNLTLREINTKRFYSGFGELEGEDHVLSKLNFMKGLENLNINLTQREIVLLWNLVDKNKDDKVSPDEFSQFVQNCNVKIAPKIVNFAPEAVFLSPFDFL